MDHNDRKMFKVKIEDAEKADEIFKILMWWEVSPRRKFIQARAKTVKNLDI
jgi:DNA gyrase subunit B